MVGPDMVPPGRKWDELIGILTRQRLGEMVSRMALLCGNSLRIISFSSSTVIWLMMLLCLFQIGLPKRLSAGNHNGMLPSRKDGIATKIF